jgi:DNA-damage-inducible protein D
MSSQPNSPKDLDDVPTLFHFDDDRESFDDLVRENGVDTWSARELMEALEYSNWQGFTDVLKRAQKAVLNSQHDVDDHFKKELREDGSADYRLTRFACYMVAMNASPTKPQVARAQAYFATIAAAVQKVVKGQADIERLSVRSDVITEQKLLGGVAKEHGAVRGIDFALFQDAGYLGLYNMRRAELAAYKGLDAKSGERILDFMGSRELAANLFRIMETRAKIEADDVRGNANLQRVHREVGAKVRKTMEDISGDAPENLPMETDIKKVRADLKQTGKKLVDKKTKRIE